ncbi:MAG: hypothetical protein K2W82_15455 [Candidatus Obscuribacterales bacterium]|nr:hypothetical protein [Candidatus Obscuribacterales bacterium]
MSNKTEKLSPLPTPGDFLFLIIMLVLMVTLPNYLFNDASTGWHLALGDYVLEHGRVPFQDFISYTFAGKPWIAFYWLADVFISLANKIAGTNGIALLIATTIASIFLAIYGRCRQSGCHLLVSLVLVFAGIIASTMHWLARPHIITFVGIYLFATTLEDYWRQRISFKKALLILVPTMLVWVNSHPGFIFGFAQSGIYLAATCLFFLLGKEGSGKSLRELLILIAAMAAVTLINPYGLALHANVAGYLKQSTITNYVDEYLSPVFHGSIQTGSLEFVFFTLALGLAFSRKQPSLPLFLSVAAFAHLALSATRNIPLFIIVALPCIGELLANISFSGKQADYLQKMSLSIDKQESLCRLHILPILTVVIFAILAIGAQPLFGKSVLSCGFDPQKVPTKTLQCIRKLPANEGFNYVNWGGYIYYEGHVPVYIDDRSSFYGEDFYLQYAKIVWLEPGWKEILKQKKINWILFPKNDPVSERLLTEPDWRILCQDEASYVFERVTK